jgi:hypothetical protein
MISALLSESQRKAAKVVGGTYLFALIPAVFAEFYVRGHLVVPGDAAQTAQNITVHERLFRLGIASNLTVFASDVALIIALYVVLKPIGRYLALLAAAWGLIETGVLVAVTMTDFVVLRTLSGVNYLTVFSSDQLHALAGSSIGEHDSIYNVGLVFAGLRSSVFCYLWFKSRYIPRGLAAWGVIASVLMGIYAFAFIIFPELGTIVSVAVYGGPIFVFELTIGLWLLIRGARPPGRASTA